MQNKSPEEKKGAWEGQKTSNHRVGLLKKLSSFSLIMHLANQKASNRGLQVPLCLHDLFYPVQILSITVVPYPSGRHSAIHSAFCRKYTQPPRKLRLKSPLLKPMFCHKLALLHNFPFSSTSQSSCIDCSSHNVITSLFS